MVGEAWVATYANGNRHLHFHEPPVLSCEVYLLHGTHPNCQVTGKFRVLLVRPEDPADEGSSDDAQADED